MYVVNVNGVRLSLLTVATNGPIVPPPDNMSTENHSGIILKGKTKKLEKKPVPVPLRPPQIPLTMV
jgi:hypothetical protein